MTVGSPNPQGPYPPQLVTTGASDFAQINNCYPFPRTLAPQESCLITVNFVPGAYGLRQGSLLVVDNTADRPQQVALVGHAYAFRAMYTLDGYGGLHPANEVSPVMKGGGYWPGWDIASELIVVR